MNWFEETMYHLIPCVKEFEGCHVKLKKDGLVYAYLCPAGYPTQGWGLLVEHLKVPPITLEVADQRLAVALPYYVKRAIAVCPEMLGGPPKRIASIADFAFNLGEVRLRNSTLRRRIRAGDWEAACTELSKWVYGGGKKLPGLVRRAKYRIELIESTL